MINDNSFPLAEEDENPLLSILLPAYEYPEGVHRILSLLRPLPLADCELIVSDDSSDDEIEKVVQNWSSSAGARVVYQRNNPALGAAANWNALLDKAQGKYCLLMHHDELPLSENFVMDLVQELRKEPDADVIMLDCILIDQRNGRCRRHMPTCLRSLVVKCFPQYLFRRNVVGPVSSLVIRRSLYPRFDVRLRWLVDVDTYVRLFKSAMRLKLCPRIRVGSVFNRKCSITNRLGASIPQIASQERAYLKNVYNASTPWLGPLRNEPIFYSGLRGCEALIWNLMRVLTRIANIFSVGPVPPSSVQQAINMSPVS